MLNAIVFLKLLYYESLENSCLSHLISGVRTTAMSSSRIPIVTCFMAGWCGFLNWRLLGFLHLVSFFLLGLILHTQISGTKIFSGKKRAWFSFDLVGTAKEAVHEREIVEGE